MNLDEMRGKIDVLDQQIVNLLNQRYAVVQKIGKWKQERGEPVRVPEREKALLVKLTELNQGPMSEKTLLAIYREIIAGSYLLEAPVESHNS